MERDFEKTPQSPQCAKCEHGCCSKACNADAAQCNKAPRGKFQSYDWLEGISDGAGSDVVEVQFKNTRKAYYHAAPELDIHAGDMVAVEASPGHDIGEVTLTGPLVMLQLKKAGPKAAADIKKVFRKARLSDLEKYAEAKSREHDTMIRSRKIAEDLSLNMKIGDVEYQGDGGKAIFYYIADERVDFRKLIRVLADTFKIRIEMKQIGARQEAGRIGGIGPCGRPICCSSWMSNFSSVGTSAARFQDISMNPQKLAGQCAKLKCCLNFEVDAYMESQRKIPHKDVTLETKDATYYFFKADILAHKVTYSTDKQQPVNCITIDASRAFEIIALNKKGVKVDALDDEARARTPERKEYVDLVGQDSLTRFDKSKKKKKKKKKPAAAQGAESRKPQSGADEQLRPRNDSDKSRRPHKSRRPQRKPQSNEPTQ